MTDKRRSILVAVCAWSLTLLGGWHSACALYDNFTLHAMFSSPGFMLGLAGASLPADLPPIARLAAEHIRLVFVFYFLVSLTVLISGSGLVLKKAWAIAAVGRLFYISAACCFIVFLFPGLLIPKPYVYGGMQLSPEFNAAVARLKFQAQILAALLSTAGFWFGRWLGKPEVRRLITR
jgi:hypothetical protein